MFYLKWQIRTCAKPDLAPVRSPTHGGHPVNPSHPGGSVRFSYAESMTDPSFYAPLARAAEDAGYDSMVIPDSICYPAESDSVYPFNPDGTREFLADKT